MKLECRIPGCPDAAVARGMCNRHWKRWRTYGDPQAPRPPVVMDERRRHNISAGLQRASALGTTRGAHPVGCGHCLAVRGAPKPPRTQQHKDRLSVSRRAAAEPGYWSMHRRIRRDRGEPASYLCACGDTAAEWALVEAAPAGNVRIAPHGVAFSIDSTDYEPKCVACHRRADSQRRRAAA